MTVLPLRDVERWIAWVRLVAVPFAVFQVAMSPAYPAGYRAYAWTTAGVFAVGAIAIFLLARRELAPRPQAVLGASALALDTAVVSASS